MGFSTHSLLSSGIYPVADEGSYFNAINPTPGTGIAQTIQTSFSGTNGVLTVRNGTAGAHQKRLFLDYVRLIPTVAPASATRSELLISLDDSTRYSSGGSSITALPNANMHSTDTSNAVVHFGALTLSAETANVRRIARAQLRAAIPVVFEEYVIRFAQPEPVAGTMAGTTALRSVIPVGPAMLGPGHSLQVHLWHPSNATTAASWEFELGWWER